MSYHFNKISSQSFAQTLSKIAEELQKEGFGIITEIDLKEKFKEKLGVNFREYRILGACNPKLAYQAIEQEPSIGTMLPCNVLVQQHENGQVEVSAINPLESMSAVDNPNLMPIAEQVSNRLQAALNRI